MRAHVAATVVAALLASNAQAAMLANIEGAVTVNRGNGFQPIVAGGQLAPGDRVSVGAGSADIVYENGCSQKIAANQVVAVLASSPPCTGGGIKDSADADPGINPLLVGGLVVGGAVGLAVALSQNHDTPHSP